MERDEKRVITYNELIKMPVSECGEKMVHLQSITTSVKCHQISPVMKEHVGDNMFLRKSVAEKLARVGEAVKRELGDETTLLLLYAYRLPELQVRRYEEISAKLRVEAPHLTDEEINVKANLFIASLDVAGHPCGAAVDVTIERGGEPLEMGTTFADFTDHEKIRTFSDKISKAELDNRLLLRAHMMKEGFAPFNGEWWHFSYGDRDWACFYKKPSAIYDIVPPEEVKRLLESAT